MKKKIMIISEQPNSHDRSNKDCLIPTIQNCVECNNRLNIPITTKAICLCKNYVIEQPYFKQGSDRTTLVLGEIIKILNTNKIDYYWTHYIKHHTDDFPDRGTKDWKKVGVVCSERWIEKEIRTWQPELIIAFGDYLLTYFKELDSNIPQKNLTKLSEEKKEYEITLGDQKIRLLILPHPSGKSRLGNSYYNKKNLEEVFAFIKESILR